MLIIQETCDRERIKERQTDRIRLYLEMEAVVKEVFSTMFQDEALVVKSLLESAGVKADIAGEHLLDVYPIFFPEQGGIKIIVPDDDAEDALAVVADYIASKSNHGSSVPASE